MDLFDRVNFLIESQYNHKKKQEEEHDKKKQELQKKQLIQAHQKNRNDYNNMTSLEQQVLQISKIEKRCKVVLVNPQKFIRLQSIYFLKTGEFIDEDQLFQQFNQLSAKEEPIKHNFSDAINAFKEIDYIIHENENSLSVNHPEFINIQFKREKKFQSNDKYLKERFESYGNSHFKMFSDRISMLENVYDNMTNNIYPNLKKRESHSLVQHGGQINKINKIVEQLLSLLQDKPVQMFYLRLGENNMIVDPQSIIFNKCFLNISGYSVQEAIQTCMEQQKVFNSYAFQDVLKVGSLAQQDIFFTKIYENFTIEQNFDRHVFQISKKDGNYQDISGRFIIAKYGLNCFTYVIGDTVYDQ